MAEWRKAVIRNVDTGLVDGNYFGCALITDMLNHWKQEYPNLVWEIAPAMDRIPDGLFIPKHRKTLDRINSSKNLRVIK
jgi:hypothetical protein